MVNESVATALIIAGAAGYFASAVLFAAKKPRAAQPFFVSAWTVNAVIFIINWVSGGHAPFANMYHVLSVLPLVVLPIELFLAKTEPGLDWMKWAFPSLCGISLVGTLFMDRSLDWSLNPALDSPFFVPHVISYCVAYAMCGVSFIMGIMFFASSEKKDRCLSAAHELIRIAVPFMTLGMCLGAVWAEEAWGIYWAWDAKETFSLVTWLIYLGFLHLMRTKHRSTVANIVQMVGFIALLGTFFGVNLLNSVHAY